MMYKDSRVQYTTVLLNRDDIVVEYEGEKVHGEIILPVDVARELVAQIEVLLD